MHRHEHYRGVYIQNNISISNVFDGGSRVGQGRSHEGMKSKWGPTLAGLGISDGQRYSEGEIVAGSAKNAVGCATEVAGYACELVGVLLKATWDCSVFAWNVGKEAVKLLK